MSASHDDSNEPAEAHHEGDHDHEPFDGSPTNELAPGEPRTPGWIPLTGLGLFLALGIYFLATMDEETTSATGAPAASSTAEPAAQAAAAPVPRPPAQGAGQAAIPDRMKDLSPEQAEKLKRKIEELRQQREAAPKP